VTPSVLVGRVGRPGGPYTLTFGGGAPAQLGGPYDAHLFISLSYVIEGGARDWAVRPTRYIYSLLAGPSTEILGYHWHPEDRSRVTSPHLHIYGQTTPVDLRKMHLPTSWVSLQAVLRLAIDDLQVSPLRDDWPSVLGEQT
jgi:hypothetical protein